MGETVLDPFCGSGTTLVEALELRRDAIGVDANPIAALIAKVKTTVLTKDELDQAVSLLHCIESQYYAEIGQKRLISDITEPTNLWFPKIFNREKWFTDQSFQELAVIKAYIDGIQDAAVSDFCKVAFSRIIIQASNQSGESRYTSVEKKIPNGKVYSLFIDQLKMMINVHSKVNYNTHARVINADVRSEIKDCDALATLLVTSPPYLNSWDYGLYHKFRFLWLGYDPKDYFKIEIGSHLRGQRSKEDIVERYMADMRACLKNCDRILKEKAVMAIVNGSSVVNKQELDTSKLIVDLSQEIGFSLIDREKLRIVGPHMGLSASLGTRGIDATFKNQKYEDVLILSR